jgi:hypothetical protein
LHAEVEAAIPSTAETAASEATTETAETESSTAHGGGDVEDLEAFEVDEERVHSEANVPTIPCDDGRDVEDRSIRDIPDDGLKCHGTLSVGGGRRDEEQKSQSAERDCTTNSVHRKSSTEPGQGSFNYTDSNARTGAYLAATRSIPPTIGRGAPGNDQEYEPDQEKHHCGERACGRPEPCGQNHAHDGREPSPGHV